MSFPSIRVQSVLYGLSVDHIERSLSYIDNAARNVRRTRPVANVQVAYGDCSPTRTLSEKTLDELRSRFRHLGGIEYTYFDANLGSAAGHNRLLEAAATDLTMILNPDVLVSPNLFEELASILSRPGVGLVEARQLPIEHPKYYDPDTGETSWASTACALGPTTLFRQLHGFDAETFFLYCDDVDFSWRIRLAGYKVVHVSSAVVLHDKRLSQKGGWISSAAERYYSAEAGLLLPYKYSRADLTEIYIENFMKSGDEAQLKASAAFELRRKSGRLPIPIDPHHVVAQFIDGAYGPHRFQTN